MTSNSVNLSQLPMIHIVYDASLSWTPVTQYPFALHWLSPKNSFSTALWMRCSPSWPSHIVLTTTTLSSSKLARLPSSTLPRPSPNPDYLTSSWQGEHGPFMWNRRTCWPSRCQRDCPKNRSIVGNMQALTWSITKRVGNQLPKSLLKTAFARQLGQKTKRAIRLNTPATDSSACPRRSPTSMSYSPMQWSSVHPNSTKLGKDKTHRASWPFVAPQNARVP